MMFGLLNGFNSLKETITSNQSDINYSYKVDKQKIAIKSSIKSFIL